MRFLIGEHSYEHPVASGQLRYERDGRPVGSVEYWRITAAPGGYTIWRVDLDAREGESGAGYLYHLLLNADGRPERLLYQVIARCGAVQKGSLLFESGQAVHRRESAASGDDRELLPWSAESRCFFPSALGLTLLLRPPFPAGGVALWPDVGDGREPVVVRATTPTIVATAAAPPAHAAYAVAWDDRQRLLAVDDALYPIAVQRPDGLRATVVRLLRADRPIAA